MGYVDETHIGQHLAARRLTRKLSMREAAKIAGISATTWSDMEKGAYPPSDSTQRKVAGALGWSLDWLERLAAGGEPEEVSRPGAVDQSRLEELERQQIETRSLLHSLTASTLAHQRAVMARLDEIDARSIRPAR